MEEGQEGSEMFFHVKEKWRLEAYHIKMLQKLMHKKCFVVTVECFCHHCNFLKCTCVFVNNGTF